MSKIDIGTVFKNENNEDCIVINIITCSKMDDIVHYVCPESDEYYTTETGTLMFGEIWMKDLLQLKIVKY